MVERANTPIPIPEITSESLIQPFIIIPDQLFLKAASASISPSNAQSVDALPSTTSTLLQPSEFTASLTLELSLKHLIVLIWPQKESIFP